MMSDSNQPSSVQSDPWLLDSFGWFDHDYKDPRYLKILKNRSYKLFGNWPYMCQGSDDPINAEIKILLLGGSTTSVVNNSTWSDHLFKMFSEENRSIAIFNGGCGLYNSFNEYMKLSRDILYMSPTLVLSMSGVNDTNASRHLSNGFAGMLVDPLISGNVYTRYNNDFPAIERMVRWLDESKNMNAICGVHHSRFIRFLQPCLCSGANPYEELSKELVELVHWMGNFLGDVDEYIKAVQRFYFSLEQAEFPDYLVDLTGAVPSQNHLWHDARHPSDEGYKLFGRSRL
jgi:hypothetical protein